MLTVDDDCYLERYGGAEDAEISSNSTTSSQCTRADKPFPDLLSYGEERPKGNDDQNFTTNTNHFSLPQIFYSLDNDTVL